MLMTRLLSIRVIARSTIDVGMTEGRVDMCMGQCGGVLEWQVDTRVVMAADNVCRAQLWGLAPQTSTLVRGL